MRSCWMNDDGSSTAQNQKLRWNTSAGVSVSERLPRPVHLVVAQHVVEAVEQPRHPADAALGEADLQVGVPVQTPEYSQSTAALIA